MTVLPTVEAQQSDILTEKLDGISSPANSDNNTEILVTSLAFFALHNFIYD
jgi:hypothetical protein